ncbi:hypothetical protein GCM10007884_22310 [Methylobacterium brachythecii]|uniref:DUF6894 domain-containing protein n=1 Tax=Methylobacterium brachythecii TaxID=1176177 RepID=A0ABQ6D7G8_9HYPH|nr:hypothetical protein GCM10007884_22310 [Methylobacterium brachythecii]
MHKYVFDVNDGDSSEWDDEDLECEGPVAIERHARRLLAEAGARQIARGSEALPATVVVTEEDGAIIMSAHGWLNGNVRVLWSQRRPRDRSVRAHVRGILLKLVHGISKAEKAEN